MNRLLYSPSESITISQLINMLILFFLVTPEKLCSSEFMKLLEPLYLRGELNRLVVDEVRRTHTHFPFSY